MSNIIKFTYDKSSNRSSTVKFEGLKASIETMVVSNLEAQVATKRFKSETAELKETMKELEKTCVLYLAKLDRINVRPLKRKSLLLANIMDGKLVVNS